MTLWSLDAVQVATIAAALASFIVACSDDRGDNRICADGLEVIRPIELEYCSSIGACPYCDCLMAPETPGCLVEEADESFVSTCHDPDGGAELAQACLDGNPACEELLHTLIDVGCSSSP